MKIGRKLGLLLGAIALQLVLLVGLSTWALQLVKISMDGAQRESARMLLALRVSSDIADLNTQMANLIISADLKLDDAQVISLERDGASALAEMKKEPDHGPGDTAQGKKLIGSLETALDRWKKSNAEIVRLAGLGKRADASQAYRAENQDRYGDAKGAIGDLLEYRRDRLATINQQRDILLQRSTAALLGIGTLTILIAIFSGRGLTLSISRPLETSVRLLKAIAGGDISQDVPAEIAGRGDETGELAKATQTMSVSLRAMVREISCGIEVLSSSSAELLATSSRMTGGSRDASDKAHLVSAASEQMSSNIASVASGMEHANGNLASVAEATEQMTLAIGDIAGSSDRARQIADDASRQAGRITDRINQLGEAAKDIGQITETITKISAQTNLLALNAAIEAARAGAAGKGFAVVATEIKSLAQQTSAATQDIRARIGGVQTATSAGMAEIAGISQVIERVTAIVDSIAAAIQEQASATRDIARNIAEATQGVAEANMRVSETSVVSREIAGDIVTVDRAASEIARGGENVRSSAEALAAIAEQLKASAARFHA
jgi:methyl-accepting chemotaxis protein